MLVRLYSCMELDPLCVLSVYVGVWTGSGVGEGRTYCLCVSIMVSIMYESVHVHVLNGVCAPSLCSTLLALLPILSAQMHSARHKAVCRSSWREKELTAADSDPPDR